MLAACAPTGNVQLTGDVEDDIVAVQAPAVPVPSPDLEAGFGGGATAGPGSAVGGASASTTPTATRVTQLGSFVRVASVRARPGDSVRSGDVLAVLDTSLLDANVRASQAAQKAAQAQVPAISAALDKLSTTKADIASTRSTLAVTIADLRATRARLVTQLATLRATLKRVESLPQGLPPGVGTTSTPGGGGGGLPPGGLPPGGLPDLAKLRAGIAQLEGAIAKIDAGLAKAESGLEQLSAASARVSDARAQLRHVSTLARIAASASSVGVDLARYQRSLAEIRSPATGVVVSIASVGDVIAPGGAVAQIRRAGRAKVSAWLAPDDLALVSVGDRAWVTADSIRGRRGGTVTRIGDRADYPPTSSATKQVHLTRALPVEITVNAGEAGLPPGTPVDISIVGSRQ